MGHGAKLPSHRLSLLIVQWLLGHRAYHSQTGEEDLGGRVPLTLITDPRVRYIMVSWSHRQLRSLVPVNL